MKRPSYSSAIMSRLFFVTMLSLAMVACSSAPRRTSDSDDLSGPPLPYGPLPTQQGPAFGPDPVPVRPIVLVLGPGAARGYAYAGVLRALHEAKIPIGAILGSDTGALIGAMYCMSPSMNDFEWKLQKLKRDFFLHKKGISAFFRKGQERARLSGALHDLFGSQDLRDCRIPLRITLPSTDGVSALEWQGGIVRALQGSLIAGSAEQSVINFHPKAFPVSEARALNIGPVVVVDVLQQLGSVYPSDVAEDPEQREQEMRLNGLFLEAEKASQEELLGADLVVRPDMSGIHLLDFDKRSDAAFQGKRAMRASLERLQELTGVRTEE